MRRRVVAAVAAGALVVGGCSGSEPGDDRAPVATGPVASGAASSAPATSGSQTSAPATSAPATSGSVTTSTTATTTTVPGPSTTDPADEQMLIGAAFLTFFGGTASDVDQKVAVLQDGERYRSMIVDASANEQFQAMAVDIRGIRLLDADACTAMGEVSPCAVVTHDLFVGGAPALVGQESAAVRLGDEWKVAASAWCRVVAIGGEQCP
jgi:hypothetical protein